MVFDFFRCPRSGQALVQTDQAVVSQDGQYTYAIVDGVPDFYIEEGKSIVPTDDANRRWLDAHAVAGRDLYYERCHEWEGMSFCLEQITRLSDSACHTLEVGAGTGHFSRWLAESCQRGTLIYSFDFSWPCIEMTRNRIAGLSNVCLFRANARGPMPFAPLGFDIIL